MNVYQVSSINDIINDYPDNSIIIDMNTYTYFLKKEGIIIPDNTTFKDAIENYYTEYAEEFSKILDTVYDFYGFSNEKETIKLKLNEISDLISFYQNYNNYSVNVDINANIDKKEIDFSLFDKIIYVDVVNGSDNNDGSQTKPFRTIYKAELEAEYNKNNLIIIKKGKYNLINKNLSFNSLSSSGIGVKNKNISYYGDSDNITDVVLYIDNKDLRYDSKFASFLIDMNGEVYNITFVMNNFSKSIPTIAVNSNVEIYNSIFVWNNNNFNIFFNLVDMNVNFDNCQFLSNVDELNYLYVKTYGQVSISNSYYDNKFEKIFNSLYNIYNYNNQTILQSFVLNKLIEG